MTHKYSIYKPEAIASMGEKIYAERYKDQFEKAYTGQFVAIDVETGQAFVATYAEDAIEQALATAPNDMLHLLRVGAASAYEMSFFHAA